MVVAVWTLVGLFWVGVAVNTWINRSESRKAKRKQYTDKLAFAIYDAVEWARVRIFHREPFEARMVRKSIENPETRYAVVAMMAEVGIRVMYAQEDGEWVLKVHNEDAPKVPAAVRELERRNLATVSMTKVGN